MINVKRSIIITATSAMVLAGGYLGFGRALATKSGPECSCCTCAECACEVCECCDCGADCTCEAK